MTKKFTQHYPEWIEMYNSGQSTVDIAKKFETNHKVVWGALKRRGVKMRQSKFNRSHEEWVDLYLSGETLAAIAKKYNTDAANVLFTLKQKGVERRKTPEMIKHEELLQYHEEWARLYEDGISSSEIARRYGEDDTTVWRAIKLSGVETRKPGEVNQKYFVQNDHAFDVIDDAEKAYWLGFLMADGNVSGTPDDHGRLLQVNLAEVDEQHIEKLRRFLITDAPIRRVESTNSVHFAVSSENLTNGLVKQGCIPRKSLIIKYPKISDDLHWSFVLGYFDGDGCVFKGKRKGSKYGVGVTITTGSEDFVIGLQQIMLKCARMSRTSLSKINNRNIYELGISRKSDIFKLHKWFYANATVYLDRKKEKFDELINNKGF